MSRGLEIRVFQQAGPIWGTPKERGEAVEPGDSSLGQGCSGKPTLAV